MHKKIMQTLGFNDEVNLVENGQCPFCKKIINEAEFKNKLSKKEYLISGLCQSCQDKYFK